MLKRILISGFTLLMFFIAAGFSHAIPIIGFSPSSTTVVAGQTTCIDLTISGLGDGSAPSLGAFEINVGYNYDYFHLTFVSLGDPILGDQLDLSGDGSDTLIEWAPGSLEIYERSNDDAAILDLAQANAFTLATFAVETQIPGTSIGLTPFVRLLEDAHGNPLSYEREIGYVYAVAQVPEPGTMLLLGTGLIGLFGIGRKKFFMQK